MNRHKTGLRWKMCTGRVSQEWGNLWTYKILPSAYEIICNNELVPAFSLVVTEQVDIAVTI